LHNISMSLPTCTVAVCTRNRPRELEQCLRAILAASAAGTDVLVVDSAPSDEQAVAIARKYEARYVREQLPGLSRARNRVAAGTEAQIVAYVDDDCVPQPGWLDPLLREFSDPGVMACAGRAEALRLETETERRCEAVLRATPPNERTIVDRSQPDWFATVNFGGVGNGYNMAFRRSAFAVWPGFDVRLGRGAPLYGSEEHYAFFALVERGYRVVFTPWSLVLHPYPSSEADLRIRVSCDICAATAYVALLWREHPEYRPELQEWLRGRAKSASKSQPLIATPAWKAAALRLLGIWRYMRTKRVAQPSFQVMQTGKLVSQRCK
jgi:glycosyltransferase involved in cell wall biosynthesis